MASTKQTNSGSLGITFILVWALIIFLASRYTLNTFEAWAVPIASAVISLLFYIRIRNKEQSSFINLCILWTVLLLVLAVITWFTQSWSIGWSHI